MKIEISFPIGSVVLMRHSKLRAYIKSILIESSGIEYECRWIHEGKLKSKWFSEWELEIESPEKRKEFNLQEFTDMFRPRNEPS